MELTRKEQEQIKRRQLILDAATVIFARDGYENASMNEIAQKSEFTKRTVYQYFIDKADLYLSVLLPLYAKMKETLLDNKHVYTNGYELTKKSIYAYYHYYKNNLKTFKIMYDIGTVRKITQNPKIEDFLDIDKQLTEALINCIELGQKDGSISTRLDSRSTTIYLKFLLTASFDKLVSVGEYYAAHNKKDLDVFTNELLQVILETIKP